MDVDLRRIVSDNFGFGDFVFRNPETAERRSPGCGNLKKSCRTSCLRCRCRVLPVSHQPEWRVALALFARHVPRWPSSLKPIDMEHALSGMWMLTAGSSFEAIVKYRKMKNQGVVAESSNVTVSTVTATLPVSATARWVEKGVVLAFHRQYGEVVIPEFEEFENATRCHSQDGGAVYRRF